MLNRFLVMLGLAIPRRLDRNCWHSKDIYLSKGLVILFDKSGPDIMRLGVQPSVRKAGEIRTEDQMEFVVQGKFMSVAAL